MKRIISACDYWFSYINLQNDEYIKQLLKDYDGHIPLKDISTFPKLQHWGNDLELIHDALTNEVNQKKYKVIYNRELIEIGGRNRIRRMLRRRDVLSKYIDIVHKIDSIQKKRQGEGKIAEDDSTVQDHANSPEYIDAKQELEQLQIKLMGHSTSQLDSYELDEEIPQQILNDEALSSTYDYEYALLRPKRIDHTRLDEDDYYIEQLNKPKSKTKKRMGKSSLPKYSSCREVQVITNTKQLNTFCDALHNEQVLGFDVEYCTLETDIRNTLPAMLSLASSNKVGLIWLDKFTNNGKDMLSDPECESLFSLLANSSIQKVGVSASSDAKHLASWFGITDARFTSEFFSGMVDMELIDNDKLWEKSLQQMVAEVLGRDLPKLKEKDKHMKKNMRKRGKVGGKYKASHWRSDKLTPEMKQYAADDAGSALDVWNTVHNTKT